MMSLACCAQVLYEAVPDMRENGPFTLLVELLNPYLLWEADRLQDAGLHVVDQHIINSGGIRIGNEWPRAARQADQDKNMRCEPGRSSSGLTKNCSSHHQTRQQ
jgi:hypothetical protein